MKKKSTEDILNDKFKYITGRSEFRPKEFSSRTFGPNKFFLIMKFNHSYMNFGPRNFRPGISVRCELNFRVRMIEFHCQKKFVRAESPGRKFLGPKFM